MKTLQDKIQAINDYLRSLGKDVIQKKQMTDKKTKKPIGEPMYGYMPHIVIAAVNRLLGPSNWNHEVTHRTQSEREVSIAVRVSLKDGEDWRIREHYGTRLINNDKVGDAFMAATTNATKKALSLFGIGEDAYADLLKDIYEAPAADSPPVNNQTPKSDPPDPTVAPSQNHDSSETPAELSSLPLFEGVSYSIQDGAIVAIGNTFPVKAKLEEIGFAWKGRHRRMEKELRKAA